MSLKGIDVTRPGIRVLFFGLVLSFFTSIYSVSSLAFANTHEIPPQDFESSPDQRGLFTNFDTSNIKILTHDGLRLDARLYEPKLNAFTGKRPAIVFTNSWTLGEHEYEFQARRFASRGYIVLSYSSRGFGGSDGWVTVGGPNDMHDFSTVLDWLEDNTRVDVANIGMAGVSLGGGMSLLALATDSRIKTAAAMSGWGNLEQALYRNETIQKAWMNILVASGRIAGHLDPDIDDQIDNMKNRTDIAATRAWAARRSPETLIQAINARRAPVFLENSYLDALFPPLQIRPFYEKLLGEKRMIVDEGIHASAAIPGLIGLPSDLWDEVHDWMDHWLIDRTHPIKTGLTFRTRTDSTDFENYPPLNFRSKDFNVLNLSSVDAGSGRSIIRFQGNRDSGATTGIPVISDSLDTYINVPVRKTIADINRKYAAVMQSPVLTRKLKVRGSPRLSFTLMPHDTPVTLVAYLYDVDTSGVGELVSFSVTSYQDPNFDTTQVSFDLNVSAFTVPRGHRLAVALDTVDPLYAAATAEDYFVSLAADPSLSIELPILP